MSKEIESSFNTVIYASTFLGLLFVIIANGIVPSWLYYSIVLGFFLYLLASILTFFRKSLAYLISLVLATTVLATSLPQGVHYQFISRGEYLFAVVFLLGDALQFLAVGLFIVWAWMRRRRDEGLGRST